jgi:alpha-L-fucosidase
VTDPETGLCCVDKLEEVTSLEKEPILECTHKNTEQCHFTYVTQFSPAQEEVCEENFEKSCQITFKQQAFNETVKKCYRPSQKVCNGQGEEVCQTVYESSCTTKYIEQSPGKFVGDTKCEKLPVEICGAGCVFEEGPEECHEKVVATLVDVPEESCDLNPQKTCRFVTRLVPKLKPENQCTTVPKETCNLRFGTPKQVPKPLQTRWCLDPTPAQSASENFESNDALEFGSNVVPRGQGGR